MFIPPGSAGLRKNHYNIPFPPIINQVCFAAHIKKEPDGKPGFLK
jgi:hypothetical protein